MNNHLQNILIDLKKNKVKIGCYSEKSKGGIATLNHDIAIDFIGKLDNKILNKLKRKYNKVEILEDVYSDSKTNQLRIII